MRTAYHYKKELAGCIYDGPKKLFPLNHLEYPASDLVYSRSDYDGRSGWTTWHHSGEERTAPELAEEIDQFTEALLQLPEFKTLGALDRFCRANAQPTCDSTEFNLYKDNDINSISKR